MKNLYGYNTTANTITLAVVDPLAMAQEQSEPPLEEQDHRDLTKDEALEEIGRVVGFRGYSRTQLRKQDLNSVYWYLTGETVADWMRFNTERSPSYILLRRAVADEVGFPYIESWSDSRPFRSNELSAIVHAVRESEDHRQHAQK